MSVKKFAKVPKKWNADNLFGTMPVRKFAKVPKRRNANNLCGWNSSKSWKVWLTNSSNWSSNWHYGFHKARSFRQIFYLIDGGILLTKLGRIMLLLLIFQRHLIQFGRDFLFSIPFSWFISSYLWIVIDRVSVSRIQY